MIDEARQVLAAARRIVSFSGAGLSAESGVPTFRDAGKGLWARYNPMQLASPEGFADDPDTVIRWYNWRRSLIADAQPNPAHRALAARDDMLHITQNVDDLLERAGGAAERIMHVHGTIARDRCHAPGCAFRESIDLKNPPALRSCPTCGSLLRPDVVWFGEPLPMDVFEQASRAVTECDALLVVGTSATVYPAAGLLDVARSSGASIVVVNPDAGSVSESNTLSVAGRAGEVLPQLLER